MIINGSIPMWNNKNGEIRKKPIWNCSKETPVANDSCGKGLYQCLNQYEYILLEPIQNNNCNQADDQDIPPYQMTWLCENC